MTRREGCVFGMAREEYDTIQRVNWSSLKHLGRSPAHYQHLKAHQREDTPALKLGRCVHLAVLEPDQFFLQAAVWDGGRRAGKDWDRFCAANPGRELLTVDERDKCRSIQQAVRNHPDAAPLLEGGSAEASLFWEHEAKPAGGLGGYRIECKGRLDFLAKVAGAIVDLKSTRDASPEGFAREADRYRYAAQAAIYQDGLTAATGERLPYAVIAVENEAPHVVQVYRLPDWMLLAGREEYRGYLDTLHHCREAYGHELAPGIVWPGYASQPLELDTPPWKRRTDDEDLSGMDLEFNAASAE